MAIIFHQTRYITEVIHHFFLFELSYHESNYISIDIILQGNEQNIKLECNKWTQTEDAFLMSVVKLSAFISTKTRELYLIGREIYTNDIRVITQITYKSHFHSVNIMKDSSFSIQSLGLFKLQTHHSIGIRWTINQSRNLWISRQKSFVHSSIYLMLSSHAINQ